MNPLRGGRFGTGEGAMGGNAVRFFCKIAGAIDGKIWYNTEDGED